MSDLHSFNYVKKENADKNAKPIFERVVHIIAINQEFSPKETVRAGKKTYNEKICFDIMQLD